MTTPSSDLLFVEGKAFAFQSAHNAPRNERFPRDRRDTSLRWRDCIALWRIHKHALWFSKTPRPLLSALAAGDASFLERRRWREATWLTGELRVLQGGPTVDLQAVERRQLSARRLLHESECILHFYQGKHILGEQIAAHSYRIARAVVIPQDVPGIASEEWPFLRALRAQPHEVLPSLIYADWLEEQGDPRSELIRAHDRAASRLIDLGERSRLKDRVALLAQKIGNNEWLRLMGYPTADVGRFISWWRELRW